MVCTQLEAKDIHQSTSKVTCQPSPLHNTVPFHTYPGGQRSTSFHLGNICLQVCHVRNGQTRAVSSPVPDLPGACSKYSQGSCCSAETSLAIKNNTFFSPQADYRWDRCYAKFPEIKTLVTADPALSAQYDRCERWFHQELCLFECDVNVGASPLLASTLPPRL